MLPLLVPQEMPHPASCGSSPQSAVESTCGGSSTGSLEISHSTGIGSAALGSLTLLPQAVIGTSSAPYSVPQHVDGVAQDVHAGVGQFVQDGTQVSQAGVTQASQVGAAHVEQIGMAHGEQA